MKKCMLVLLAATVLLGAGCKLQPAWIAPSVAPLRTPVPTDTPQTPAPVRFDEMAYLNALLGGGHEVEGSTLKLGRNVVIDAPICLANYKALTIDLQGYSISYEPQVQKTQNTWTDSIFTLDGSDVTLCSSRAGGTLECDAAVIGITALNHAALRLEGVNVRLPLGSQETSFGIYLTEGAYGEIDRSLILADCALLADDPQQAGTTIVINGGEFGADASLCGVYVKNTVTGVIKDGVFRGSNGGLYTEGNPYITVYHGDFNKISDAAGSNWLPALGGGAVWETNDTGTLAR